MSETNQTTAIDLLREGLWEVLRKQMMDSSLPVVLGCVVKDTFAVTSQIAPISQGTMTFIDTGDKVFGVTAAHVITGLRKEICLCTNSKLFVNEEICHDFTVVDIDEVRDIAVLEVNEKYLVNDIVN